MPRPVCKLNCEPCERRSRQSFKVERSVRTRVAVIIFGIVLIWNRRPLSWSRLCLLDCLCNYMALRARRHDEPQRYEKRRESTTLNSASISPGVVKLSEACRSWKSQILRTWWGSKRDVGFTYRRWGRSLLVRLKRLTWARWSYEAKEYYYAPCTDANVCAKKLY